MSIKSFIDYLQLEKKYSPNTIKAYENDIMSFSDYNKNEFDQSSINKVDYSQLRSWIVKLVESKISNRSINRKISSLNTYYKFLLKIEKIKKSTADKGKKSKRAGTQKDPKNKAKSPGKEQSSDGSLL